MVPDLVVTELSVAPSGVGINGGERITVSWTVANESTGTAAPAGWTDAVYLSDRMDPFEQGAKSFYLGNVVHNDTLSIRTPPILSRSRSTFPRLHGASI